MNSKTLEREGLKNQVTTIDEFVALIQDWYKNNTKINPDFPRGFKDMFDSAVSGVNPIPSGTDPSVIYNWQNATIDTLCSFFKEWYAWNPDLTTGLEYIQKFSWLYFENEAGLVFVGNDSGREMTYQFVELNGAKSVFEHFRRGYMIIETKEYGHIAMIPVGLNTIASVIFKDEYKNLPTGSNVPIKKGDEVGWFQYGGSLNILLFEEGVFPSVRIPQGQMLGNLNKKASNSTKTEFTF